MTPTTSEQEARELARRFHEAYERLAPQFGYETRAETRVFDPESANGKLMIATCAALLDGQPAGVVIDDAMVERAMEAADQVFAEKFGSRPVADETDTAMMRAALQAALGGGGGR